MATGFLRRNDREWDNTKDSAWEAISQAIGASLLGQQINLPADVDWADVYEQSKRQGIAGIVYQSIEESLPATVNADWKYYNRLNISRSVHLIHEQHCLQTTLEGIPFIILKGTAAAVYYPTPLLRTMGDIDFVVHHDWFEVAEKKLLDAGYKLSDEDNPRHIKLCKNGITLEMHHHFGHDAMDIDQYIERCYERLEEGIIQNTSFPMLPKLENGLILLAHLRQHLFTGVGMRQVLDWMMYVNSTLNDAYWKDAFQPEVRTLGMEKLAITTAHLCQMYFGLDRNITWCSSADENVCSHMMQSIITSGNFGHINKRGKNIEATVINLRREGFFRYLQKAGEYNWEAYHKNPTLRPFAWIYQIGRFARQGLITGRNASLIRTDVQRSSDRFDLLRELDL